MAVLVKKISHNFVFFFFKLVMLIITLLEIHHSDFKLMLHYVDKIQYRDYIDVHSVPTALKRASLISF